MIWVRSRTTAYRHYLAYLTPQLFEIKAWVCRNGYYPRYYTVNNGAIYITPKASNRWSLHYTRDILHSNMDDRPLVVATGRKGDLDHEPAYDIGHAPEQYLPYERRYYAGLWWYRVADDAPWQPCQE